jgi:hypothetical protein
VSRCGTTTRYFLFFPEPLALAELTGIGTATFLLSIERDDDISKRYVN